MADTIIQEWLNDYISLSSVELHSYASSLQHNDDVISAVHNVLEDSYKNPKIFDTVCNQLLQYYRSTEVELRRFTLQFLPTLIYNYLNAVSHGDKKNCRSVETLLISIYNIEIVDDQGQPVVISFRLPSLAQASIYHEPMSLAHASLTESALRRLEECNTKLVSWGPLPVIVTINAQNRLKIMTALFFIYNRNIGTLNKSSLRGLCKITSQLVTQGFLTHGQTPRPSHANDSNYVPRLLPRIPVCPEFLLELVSGLYYAMYNEYGYMSVQSIEDVYNRACYECYSDVILVTTAIKNSSHITSSGRPNEGPMGISVALSPATTTVTTVKKSMITNASFRTKKLPDDIPIITEDEGTTGESKNLTSISEEEEIGVPPTRGSSIRETVAKNKQKFSNLPGLKKIKDSKSNIKNGIDKKQISKKPIHNGDSSDDPHSPLTSNRKSSILENGPLDSSGGIDSEGISGNDSTDTYSLEESCKISEKSPSGLKSLDDKPFMQVSSV